MIPKIQLPRGPRGPRSTWIQRPAWCLEFLLLLLLLHSPLFSQRLFPAGCGAVEPEKIWKPNKEAYINISIKMYNIYIYYHCYHYYHYYYHYYNYNNYYQYYYHHYHYYCQYYYCYYYIYVYIYIYIWNTFMAFYCVFAYGRYLSTFTNRLLKNQPKVGKYIP